MSQEQRKRKETLWTAFWTAAFLAAVIVVLLWSPAWMNDLAGFVETGQLGSDLRWTRTYDTEGDILPYGVTTESGTPAPQERFRECLELCADEACADACMERAMNKDVRVLGVNP